MLPRSHARPLISILAQSGIPQHARALHKLHTSPQRLAEQPPFSTVNDAEIAHFSRLSELWWDEHGEFALLHKMNAHRMHFIRETLLLEPASSPPDAIPARAFEPSCVLAGLDVLDVGCGGGILSEVSPFFFCFVSGDLHTRIVARALTRLQSLARLGANTLAVDASSDNIRIASRHAAADPRIAYTLTFQHTSVEALVQEPRRFDVVCSMEVVEHVGNPAAFLRSCAELVKVR